jgi:F5/8 type C domain
MPVDKFGRTDSASAQRVVSGGVTMSQATSVFLQRDGGNAITGDINLDSHKLINVKDPVIDQDAATKNYVDTRKVSKSGDTITGDLLLSTGSEHIFRALGCIDLNANSRFSIYLGDILNKIKCRQNRPIAIDTNDGFRCELQGQKVIRFGVSSEDLRIVVYSDIVMNQCSIADLREPNDAQDAATKNYVDSKPKKNFVGYIPILEGNVSITGFAASASSTSNSNRHQPYGAFNHVHRDGANGSWVTAGGTTTGWLQIKCPDRVKIWRVVLKARNIADRDITAWNLSASNDETTFTTLLESQTILSGNATEPSLFYVISSDAYQYYRFAITASTGSNDVGVQAMQLFVYDL